MKKICIILFSLVAGAVALQSCEDMDDNAVPVNDFIWKGLNLYYLWQEDIPNLADDRFSNQGQLNNFLQAYDSPETLFESLLYREDAGGRKVDRWSVLFSDFRTLENLLQGTSKSNGMEYGLSYTDASQIGVFGYVRYILPDTDAAGKDIHRGDIFYAINGTTLNRSNYQELLSQGTYTLNLADDINGTITPNGRTVSLTKSEYSENPVYIHNTYTSGSHKIGYLMYNGFYSNYDAELNNAFGQFASEGVTDLVLDLRYNGGGSVRTATYLASMITGQFNGQLFAREQWNAKLQAYLESNNANSLDNLFTDKLTNNTTINSLNLNKVYILTSGTTASASELVINCLQPYIDVVVIGDTTTGKNVGSVTLYDSPTFSSKDRNGSHRYAMQPIVLKTVNKSGFGEYSDGIAPQVILKEKLTTLGILGNPAEPLYAAAIAKITQLGKPFLQDNETGLKTFKDSKSIRPFGNEMYKEEMPNGSLYLLKNLQ
ncbi:S41 family peptidase [Flavobacterium psychrotrophum]|uniref:S41 family peptidase n=1 Tax=Flavobacterium psychrotrophum TaxID=2294119 RepID=UPI000E31633C|nr:S41 family peptidase [Flavobacterium psychrotrophum]